MIFDRKKNYSHLKEYKRYEYHLMVNGELQEGSFQARCKEEAIDKAIRIRRDAEQGPRSRVDIGFVEG